MGWKIRHLQGKCKGWSLKIQHLEALERQKSLPPPLPSLSSHLFHLGSDFIEFLQRTLA
jgi:hypothetical protein